MRSSLSSVVWGIVSLCCLAADGLAGTWSVESGSGISARAKEPAGAELLDSEAMTLSASGQVYAEATSPTTAFGRAEYTLAPSSVSIAGEVYSNGDVQVIGGVERHSFAISGGTLIFTLTESMEYTFTLDAPEGAGAATANTRLALGKTTIFAFSADGTQTGTLAPGTYVLTAGLSANHLSSTPQPPMFGSYSATLSVPEPAALAPLAISLTSLLRRRRSKYQACKVDTAHPPAL